MKNQPLPLKEGDLVRSTRKDGEAIVGKLNSLDELMGVARVAVEESGCVQNYLVHLCDCKLANDDPKHDEPDAIPVHVPGKPGEHPPKEVAKLVSKALSKEQVKPKTPAAKAPAKFKEAKSKGKTLVEVLAPKKPKVKHKGVRK